VAGGLTRAAEARDLDGLERLENAVFPGDRLSRRSLRRYIDAPTTELLVADGRRDTLAGYALVAFRKGSTLARLYSIAVDEAASGSGIGRVLLAAAEDAAQDRKCRALRLEVRSDNARAITLYERNGYVRFGEIDDYYEDGAAALRFEKALGAWFETRLRRSSP
jgi:ribosomal protein S18 acetylase RimI-like enzyme